MPFTPSLLGSFSIGTIGWLLLKYAANGPPGFSLPPFSLQIVFYGIPFLLLKVSTILRIFVRNDSLQIRYISIGGHRTGKSIALNSIISCEKRPYSCSIVQLVFADPYQEQYRKFLVPGYKGQGLLIKYSAPNPFTDVMEEHAILIPVKNPELLLNLCQTDSRDTG